MLTCMPTRFLAPTGAYPANATPWLESAPHNFHARRSPLIHTADAPINASTRVTGIHFVLSQPRRLNAKSFQSPYFYRASGLRQIAISALLRTSSTDARKFSQRSSADTALEIWLQLSAKHR
jgi:hypothetical protein